MQSDVDRLSHALALSHEADRVIAELHAAIRCLCCPDGLFRRLVTDEADSRDDHPSATARVLRRSDFLGMLKKHEVDAGLGGAD